MNDLQTRPQMQSNAYSAPAEITVELAKMLSLVAPTSMSAEQQELWLRAAVDSLQDIRPDEIHAVSLEVRRSVQRPSQIVPEISKLVSLRRNERARQPAPSQPMVEIKRPDPLPLTEQEIHRMPKWLKEMGLRVGFLKRVGGELVDAT